MADDLSKLSSADIRRFEKAVSDAKALPARQEEIAKKVLAAEEDIGKVRLAYLTKYFDAYSVGLDEIITRKTSQLNDAFLVMEQRAIESFKKAVRDGQSQSKSSSQEQTGQKRVVNTTAEEPNDNTTTPRVTKSTQTKSSNGSSSVNASALQPDEYTPYVDGGVGSGGNGGGGGKKPPAPSSPSEDDDSSSEDVEVSQLQSDTVVANLGDDADAASDIVERLSAFGDKTVNELLEATTKRQEDAVISLAQLDDMRAKKQKEQSDAYEKRERSLAGTLAALMLSAQQADEQSSAGKEARIARIKDLQIQSAQEVAEAELSAQKLVMDFEAERLYAAQNAGEIGGLRARKAAAAETQKSIQQVEAARVKYIERQELAAKRRNNGILTAEEYAKIQQLAAEKFKLDEQSLDKLTRKRLKQEEQATAKAQRDQMDQSLTSLIKGDTWEERIAAWQSLTHNEAGEFSGDMLKKALGTVADKAVAALGEFIGKLESTIKDIGSYQSDIDTRLQGSSNKTFDGSYWKQISKDIISVGAINPYFKQDDFAKNVKSLVDQGIAFDLEQRAFLMTIKDKIATTFEVADGTLLKLIRIQQEDTTAGRLGMEAALNAFLNNMYENTEYLKQVASNVRSSLAEMQSLMSGAEATEVEYQVQKWLGSLYSVGMSNEAVNSISATLGQIAAGQIEGLTNGGTGNLLVMAANEADLSIADILTSGLDSSETNRLMQAIVNYLAEIAESSKGNNVVQQQLANVFGVNASDLRAATNLTTKNSISAIYDNSSSYSGMLSYLTSMAGSMGDRISLSEQMSNIWENVQYSMSSGIANNPVLYFLYKTASALESATGGIPIPDVLGLGNGVMLHTTVADLMRVGSMAFGILGNLGEMISGLGNSFDGQAMLSQLGISSGSGIAITPRGDGSAPIQTGGGSTSVSKSGYVGNAASSDIKSSTMQEAADTKKQLMVEAQETEEANQINVLNTTVLKIYELLDDVAHGNGCFRVKVENYGLTKTGGAGSQGGVGGLNNLSGGNNQSSLGGITGSTSAGSLANGGVNSGGLSGSMDFGGWTTVM